MLSFSPIVAQLSQPRVQKAFKRSRDIASPSVWKARGVSTSALSHCVFPPPNSQSSPSEPERRGCLSSHAASLLSVNRRCLDGPRPSSPSPVLSVRATAVDHRPLLACGVSWWRFSVNFHSLDTTVVFWWAGAPFVNKPVAVLTLICVSFG